jgi:kinesin family protein 26
MDQLARLRELFNSQLAMAEVIPAFRIDSGSVYSEPAFRFTNGPGSVCSEPVYRAPSPRQCRDCRQSISRTPSQTSLPSLNGIVAIAGMEPYASLRHPDGASDPNIKKSLENCDAELSKNVEIHIKENPLAEICETELIDKKITPQLNNHNNVISSSSKPLPHLPLLPISTPEAYDSGHDSTPRASKHSGISRRAESGYHSVATVRDSDESSFSSSASRPHPHLKNSSNNNNNNIGSNTKNDKSSNKKKGRQDKSLCQWLTFTCTYSNTEGDVSDF